MAADSSIDAAEAVALFRYKLIAEAANPRLGPAERGNSCASSPANRSSCRMASFVSLRAARSIAGCGPTVSKAWPDSNPSHALTWALPAAIRSCWRKPASYASSYRRARRRRSAPFCWHATASGWPSAPFVNTSSTVVCSVPLWRSSRTCSVASRPRGRTSYGLGTC